MSYEIAESAPSGRQSLPTLTDLIPAQCLYRSREQFSPRDLYSGEKGVLKQVTGGESLATPWALPATPPGCLDIFRRGTNVKPEVDAWIAAQRPGLFCLTPPRS